jgi:hypothetical protein
MDVGIREDDDAVGVDVDVQLSPPRADLFDHIENGHVHLQASSLTRAAAISLLMLARRVMVGRQLPAERCSHLYTLLRMSEDWMG